MTGAVSFSNLERPSATEREPVQPWQSAGATPGGADRGMERGVTAPDREPAAPWHAAGTPPGGVEPAVLQQRRLAAEAADREANMQRIVGGFRQQLQQVTESR